MDQAHTVCAQLKMAADSAAAAADRMDRDINDLKKANMADLVAYYHYVRGAYDHLEKVRKNVYHLLEYMNKGLIPERFDNEGLDKIQVPEVGQSFYPVIKYSASFVDKDAGLAWLRGQGAESLITETVNAQTLAGYVRDLMLNEGIDPPADKVKFSTYKVTGSSKYTPKKES